MRLIDADALTQELAKGFVGSCGGEATLEQIANDDTLADAIMTVNNQPTIDAVPVVRCRDCAFCLFGYQCLPNDEPTKPDNYCWKGRREDATD